MEQDKILQSMGRGQEITVTNDGATILKSIYIDNPAAKVLVGELIGRGGWDLGLGFEKVVHPSRERPQIL